MFSIVGTLNIPYVRTLIENNHNYNQLKQKLVMLGLDKIHNHIEMQIQDLDIRLDYTGKAVGNIDNL